MRSWSKQKELLRDKLPPKSWVVGVAQSIEKPMLRTLVVLLYLTAGRISEVLSLNRGDLLYKEEKERIILLVSMPNRKNKRVHFKQIPIPLDSEKELVSIVDEYIRDLPEDQLLFPINKITAWKKLQKYKINPHYLRHLRLSHLVLYNNFNEQLLIQFAGWSDSRPARHYMHLRYTDMIDRL